MELLDHPLARHLHTGDGFAVHLLRGRLDKTTRFSFTSDRLGIFICFEGHLMSSTPTLDYQLQKNLVSFALEHRCGKTVPADTDIELLVLLFDRRILEEMIERSGENVSLVMQRFTSCQCTVNTCNREILGLARRLYGEITGRLWGFALSVDLVFRELAIQFVRLFSNPAGQPEDPVVRELKTMIEADLARELDLAPIAAEMGMTKSHLCKIFKHGTGQTMTQFLNACRVRAACDLLKDPTQTIAAVAERAGFNNLNYFYRVFKKVTGTLPAEFRKRLS